MENSRRDSFSSPPELVKLLDATHKELALGKYLNNVPIQNMQKFFDLRSELEAYLSGYKFQDFQTSYKLNASLAENWVSALREIGQLRRNLAENCIEELHLRTIDGKKHLKEINNELKQSVVLMNDVIKTKENGTNLLKTIDKFNDLWEFMDLLQSISAASGDTLEGMIDFIIDKYNLEFYDTYKSKSFEVIQSQITWLVQYYEDYNLSIEGKTLSELQQEIQENLHQIEDQITLIENYFEEIDWLKNVQGFSTMDEEITKEHAISTDGDDQLDYSIDQTPFLQAFVNNNAQSEINEISVDGDDLPDMSVDDQAGLPDNSSDTEQSNIQEVEVGEEDVDGDDLPDMSVDDQFSSSDVDLRSPNAFSNVPETTFDDGGTNI